MRKKALVVLFVVAVIGIAVLAVALRKSDILHKSNGRKKGLRRFKHITPLRRSEEFAKSLVN